MLGGLTSNTLKILHKSLVFCGMELMIFFFVLATKIVRVQ